MLDKIAKAFEFQQHSLKLRSYRSGVLASNIANDETPNYKAMDFDFGQVLRAQTDAQQHLALNLTNKRHILGGLNSDENGLGVELQYRSVVQPSLDGNTVDMDVERAAFADNAIRFQSTLAFISKRINSLNAAIQGQGSN